MSPLRQVLSQAVRALTRTLQPRLRTWLAEPIDPGELFEPAAGATLVADSIHGPALDAGDRQLLAAAGHDHTMLRRQLGSDQEDDDA